MRRILDHVDARKEAFGTRPLFELLRDRRRPPEQRLTFVPAMAHFVMSFADLNKHVLRAEPDGGWQDVVNAHTAEDDHHWPWYLADLGTLGVDDEASFSETLRRLWSDDTVHTRRLSYEIAALARHAPALDRLVIIEAIEATGHVLFRHLRDTVHELGPERAAAFTYLGDLHLGREQGHAAGGASTDPGLRDVPLDAAEAARYVELVDRVFDLFVAWVDELAAHAAPRPTAPLPLDVPTPEGAEGWEHMYPPYTLFSRELADWEAGTMWFQDRMHHPEVMYPFDTITHDAWRVALGQVNTRIFAVPPAYGLEPRVLNGYVYVSPVAVTDPDEIARRTEVFERRAGYYFANWDALFERWKEKVEALIGDLAAVEVPTLPALEDEAVVRRARGYSSGFTLLKAYDDVVQNFFLAWQYHFEMLNLGYAAYLDLFQFAHGAFPGITDETIAQMISGAELLLLQPDARLRDLARLATRLGVERTVASHETPAAAGEQLRESPAGREWLAAYEAAQEPWFHLSTGTGFYHHHRAWIDEPGTPWAALRRYVGRLAEGADIEPDRTAVLERRDVVTGEHEDRLDDPAQRRAFREKVELARRVSGYVEDHNFYIEHWHHSLFWNKIRAFGERLAEGGILDAAEDVFCLHRWEVGRALYELVATWATCGPALAPHDLGARVEERRRILDRLRAWTPPPVLGTVPPQVTEPMTVMLWGITSQRLADWLDAAPGPTRPQVTGVAASPGVAEGVARVVDDVATLDEVGDGEILVCPITAPSWAVVFDRIAGAVSDIGGMMSHAAIVSRECGLPAVVGTGVGTKVIRTGDRVRVDGSTGTVTVLDDRDDLDRDDLDREDRRPEVDGDDGDHGGGTA